MSVRGARDAALVVPRPKPDAARRLVCLGFCGGGTAAYRPWESVLGPSVELVLICYPGRDGRYGEPLAQNWAELAADATDKVNRAADRPYGLFGHSMGGWMAFEVATRLGAAGGPLPDRLIVSSCNAPDRPLTARDRFPSLDDPDESLLTWMATIGALPSYVRADPDLTAMALKLMRADLAVRDTYRPPAQPVTTVPTQLLFGSDDAVMERDVGPRWARLCRNGCQITELPGGHFYRPDIWSTLPDHFDRNRSAAPVRFS